MFIQYIEVVTMKNINNNILNIDNNNLLKSYPIKNTSSVSKITPWCNIINITNALDLSENYQNICQRHRYDRKWVLMINPENESLNYLSNIGKINPSKILKVNSNKVNVDIEHIKSTLLKGTCAAIILSNSQYNATQIRELSQCATKGKTQCIVLKQTTDHVHLH